MKNDLAKVNNGCVGLIKCTIDPTLIVFEANEKAKEMLSLNADIETRFDTKSVVDLETLTFDYQDSKFYLYFLSLQDSGKKMSEAMIIKQPSLDEERLHHDAFFNILFERTNFLIWQYDIKKDRLYRSEAVVKESGYGSIIDNPAEYFVANGTIHPQSADEYKQIYEDVKNGEDTVAIVKYRRADGQYFWFQKYFYVVKNEAGEPVYAIGSGEQIVDFINIDINIDQYRKIISSDVIFFGEINFALNQFIVNGKKVNRNNHYSYEQFLNYVIRYYEIKGQDRKDFIEFASYQNVKSSSELGKASIVKDFLLTTKALQPKRWCQITIAGYHNDEGQACALFAVKDVDEKKRREIKLELHSSLDALTQTYNRTAFESMVNEIINNKKAGVLFVIDVDNFKTVNDLFGHSYGDDMLINLAERITSIIGSNDFAARLGGDEFAVWIDSDNDERVKNIARKMLEQCYLNFEHDGRVFNISLSIGGAFFPHHGQSFLELYNNAAKAQYMAKECGKNQYTVYRPDITNYSGIEYQTPEWILDMLDEVVYVTALETCDLLYMNKRGREITKLNDRNYKTLKCHKVICGFDERCPFCRYDVLTTDRFHTHAIDPRVSDLPMVGKGRIVNWNGVVARLEIVGTKEKADYDLIGMKNKLEDEEKLRKLVNASSVAMARWTSIHTFPYATESFKKYAIYGASFEDLKTMNISHGEIHPDDYSLCRHEIIREISSGKNVASTNVRLRLKDNTHEWCRMEVKVNRKDGEVYDIVMILYPICANPKENENWQKQIEKYNNFDPLTGLFAHKYFVSQIETLEKDPNYVYYIISCDINNFTYINDTYGYDFANKILTEFAGHLENQKNSRFDHNCTLISRSAGDNFLILSRISKAEENPNVIIHDLANGIIDDFNEISKYRFGGYIVSFVMGISLFDACETNMRKMIDNAVLARKTSKDKNNIPVTIFDPAMRQSKDDEVKIEQNALKAFQDEEFVLYYQPKVSAQTGEIVSCEALVRWQSKEFGFLPPNSFIPLFEKTGLIVELDYYVLMKACRRMRKFIDDGFKPCQVAINQSRHHFSNPNYINEICNIVDRYQIPHHLIEFEITENVFLENSQSIVQKISTLQQLGFSVALDDFGSGFSSLNVLNDLAVDVVKLDRALIKEIETSDRSKIILENIIKMAKEMDSVVVNEGVETLNQVNFLKNTKCDIIQGFYYYRPLPEETFYEVYAKQLTDRANKKED